MALLHERRGVVAQIQLGRLLLSREMGLEIPVCISITPERGDRALRLDRA